jgi:hypothetical protein
VIHTSCVAEKTEGRDTYELRSVKKQKGILVLYGANTWGGGVKSTNCVKIATCTRLVSYNSEANVTIVKIAKPRR